MSLSGETNVRERPHFHSIVLDLPRVGVLLSSANTAKTLPSLPLVPFVSLSMPQSIAPEFDPDVPQPADGDTDLRRRGRHEGAAIRTLRREQEWNGTQDRELGRPIGNNHTADYQKAPSNGKSSGPGCFLPCGSVEIVPTGFEIVMQEPENQTRIITDSIDFINPKISTKNMNTNFENPSIEIPFQPIPYYEKPIPKPKKKSIFNKVKFSVNAGVY